MSPRSLGEGGLAHQILMPIFEYKCPSCGKMQEILVKTSGGEVPACPDCGRTMEKRFSSFAAVVKEPPKPTGRCQGCSKACPMQQ